MKKFFTQVLAMGLIFGLAISIVSIAKATTSEDSCNQVFEYQKSSDYDDSRVTIDFTNTVSPGNPDKIEVEAENGYTLVKIELDVENDNHNGFFDYSSHFPGIFNPDPGETISSAKVQVAKVCNKVDICHSTSSNSNPYVQNQPNTSGDVSGHDDHDGGIYPADPWGDIIPPFYYNDGFYTGKNWTTEGRIIWENNCEVPEDLCTNIEGVQAVVPQGYEDPNCDKICTPIEEPPTDLCTNIEGVQTEIPQGLEDPDEDKICTDISRTPTPTPVPSISPQILGTSTASPAVAKATTQLPTTGGTGNSIYFLILFLGLFSTYYLKKEGWQRIG